VQWSGVAAFLSTAAVLAFTAFISDTWSGWSADRHQVDQHNLWTGLLSQASELALPTQFLRSLPPGFVVVEFADLRTYAAEYHPETHLMVLNRALSFNAAGRVLKPLAKLNHRDIATIYHELFHAYLDYVSRYPDPRTLAPDAQNLLALAREQQECRYTLVHITPLPQKKTRTEPRFLTDHESWEALNETWAVFVGWAVWTKLEIGGSGHPAREKFSKSLKKADESGLLVGYYEPEDKTEREITRKRYLAPGSRITRSEVAALLKVVLGEPPAEAVTVASVMAPDPLPVPGTSGCQASLKER